jgi:hypothetical protein
LRTYIQPHSKGRKAKAKLALALTLALAAIPVTPAMAGGGGTSSGGDGSGGCGRDARLVDGRARAPDCAPFRVKRVIRAANEIAKGKGYCYGGGHSSFKSSCYDCSGAVSYALHGGNFVDSPMPSGAYMRWGSRGRGKWFTVFANSGHMYLVIAGLRFDTSMTPGEGPGWSKEMRSSDGYKKRHKGRF